MHHDGERESGMLMVVSMPDLNSAIDSLRKSLASTETASRLSSSHPDDALQEMLVPFLAAAKPQVTKLNRLHVDLQREVSTLLSYFGEKEGGGGVEHLFSTVLTFAHGLQKAATEMTRHAVRDEEDKEKQRKQDARSASGSSVSQNTLDAMSHKLDRHEAMLSAVTIKRHSLVPPVNSGAPAGLAATLAPPPAVMGGTMRGLTHGRKSVRGTLSRGELDEAIRSIHGGVKRRERETLGRGGGVRLSKMFLDGGGGGHAQGRVSTAGSGRMGGTGVRDARGGYESVRLRNDQPVR